MARLPMAASIPRQLARRFPRLGALIALLLLVLAAALAPAPSTAQPYSEWVHYRRFDLPSPWGRQRVLVTFPRRGDHRESPPGERYPVLIALHGRGEALQGPEHGYLGWTVRYGLPDAFAALLGGRVSLSQYRGFAREPHLDYVNDSLRGAPLGGVMVVTPYIPDVGSEPLGSASMRELGDWMAGPLLAEVRERFAGAARTREGAGIDGVSLGGRVALEVGFAHPEAFGAVGATQPAIRGLEEDLSIRAIEASRRAPQRVRLLTSDDDPFLWATRRLSTDLRDRRFTHTLTVVPGPHDYAFNRGPGGIEMLLFHDRALAREPE
jgi:predicted esterase